MIDRTQALNDARTMLNWLEAHPTIPLPDVLSGVDPLNVFGFHTKEDAAMVVREFGECRKEAKGTLFLLTKRFGLQTLRIVFTRSSVCERVVVATEEIPETVIPEIVVPAHVKETVEWRCPSSILAAESKDEAVEEVDAALV